MVGRGGSFITIGALSTSLLAEFIELSLGRVWSGNALPPCFRLCVDGRRRYRVCLPPFAQICAAFLRFRRPPSAPPCRSHGPLSVREWLVYLRMNLPTLASPRRVRLSLSVREWFSSMRLPMLAYP